MTSYYFHQAAVVTNRVLMNPLQDENQFVGSDYGSLSVSSQVDDLIIKPSIVPVVLPGFSTRHWQLHDSLHLRDL